MNNYEINTETLAIIPIDENITRVYEVENEFDVYCPIMKIIDNSCKFFGSSYEGRFEGTKAIINISHKSPIIIEESKKIIFFPTRSPRINTCSWISFNNIEKYYKDRNETVIVFTNGRKIKFDLSYGIIDNQVLRSTRLNSILERRILNNN